MTSCAVTALALEVFECRAHGVWFDPDDLLLVARAAAQALDVSVWGLARALHIEPEAPVAETRVASDASSDPRPRDQGLGHAILEEVSDHISCESVDLWDLFD